MLLQIGQDAAVISQRLSLPPEITEPEYPDAAHFLDIFRTWCVRCKNMYGKIMSHPPRQLKDKGRFSITRPAGKGRG